MVLDCVTYAAVYDGLSPILQRALGYLTATDWGRRAPGRHDFEGDDLFAIVADYHTRPPAEVPWEAHRRYIDVQYVHSGRERIGHADLATLAATPYDEARDLVSADGPGGFVTLTAGAFAILWPHDAHRPGVAVDGPEAVRKVVLKVAYNPRSAAHDGITSTKQQ